MIDWTRVSTSTGYRVIFNPSHPRAWSTGYVYEHILVAEWKIGRFLRSDEVVHHIDRDKLNNSPANLEVLTRSEHSSHHAEAPSVSTFWCAECGKQFTRRSNQRPSVKGYKRAFCDRSCFYASRKS